MELETERPRLSFFRLPGFLALRVRFGRVQEPKRQVGLPARRQVGLGFDSGLPAQIRLSFCPLEAASRAELLWLLHQLAESLRVARPVFLCALFRALPEMAKPEPLPERNLAMLQHLAE